MTFSASPLKGGKEKPQLLSCVLQVSLGISKSSKLNCSGSSSVPSSVVRSSCPSKGSLNEILKVNGSGSGTSSRSDPDTTAVTVTCTVWPMKILSAVSILRTLSTELNVKTLVRSSGARTEPEISMSNSSSQSRAGRIGGRATSSRPIPSR